MQPGGVDLPLQCLSVVFQKEPAAALLLQSLDFLPLSDGHAEGFRQESGDSLQFRQLWRLRPAFPVHVRIFGFQRIFIRVREQIPVVQKPGALHPVPDAQAAQSGIILCHHGRLVGGGEQDVGDAKRQDAQQIPPQEGQLQHEAFPFMAVHEPSGQGDRIQGLHGRVLRQEIGHQVVGIGLDHAADQGQAPEEQEEARDEVRHGHMAPFLHPQQEPDPLSRHLLIAAPLQEHPYDHRPAHAYHEYLEQAQQGQRPQQQDDYSRLVRPHQGAQAHQQGHQIGPGGQLVHHRGEHTPAPAEYLSALPLRFLCVAPFLFPDPLFPVFLLSLRHVYHEFREGGGDCVRERHPGLGRHVLRKAPAGPAGSAGHDQLPGQQGCRQT